MNIFGINVRISNKINSLAKTQSKMSQFANALQKARSSLRQAVRELRNQSDMPRSKAISESAKRLARQVESHGTKSEERGAA